MKRYTTSEAAARVGVSHRTLQRWIDTGKIKVPPVQRVGVLKFRLWTNRDIASVKRQMKQAGR